MAPPGARVLGFLIVAGCTKDVVLPDATLAPVCGNRVVETGEACDVASEGCVACQVLPTWTCSDRTCTSICGDGVVGTGPSCASARREADCDMTGYWAARETDHTRDSVVGGVQTSSNWFLYRFAQTGDAFEVTASLDCGVHVTGEATVDSTPGSLRGAIHANRMDAASPHGARGGTSKLVSGGCAITLDRWYRVLGASEAFLPADFSRAPALGSLPALPSVSDPVSSEETPAGAVDPDGDGIPGIAFLITGAASGIRNAAQRTRKEYASLPSTPAAAGALVVSVPGAFDLQESVLRVTQCGAGCGLMAVPARVAQDLPARVALSFVGKTLGSARVSEVVARAPREDLDADLTTCARVRLMLPHDPSVP